MMSRRPVSTSARTCRPSIRWSLLLILAPCWAAAGAIDDGLDAYRDGDYESAYRLLSPAATVDNPDLQNLVALMLYLGRGTPADPVAAHELFHSAAMNGSVTARRNLGILHTLGAPGIDIDFREARIWFSTAQVNGGEHQQDRVGGFFELPRYLDARISLDAWENSNGKRIYLTFCAGCHGFSGMRFFKYAPSFAMGQRLTKSDAELMDVILHGKGLMPSWENMLPLSDLEDALAYLRVLAIQTAYGMDVKGFNEEPDVYFIFFPRAAGQADIVDPHTLVEDDY